jgi:hypothetical protein
MFRKLSVLALVIAACGSDDPSITPIDVTARLALDQPMQLELGDFGVHTFTLLQHRPSRAILKIESEPQTWAFTPGTAQAIDLNGEGGPEIVVDVTINDDETVTVHIVDIVAGMGMGSIAPPPDPWTLPANPEPPGTVLHRLTIVGQSTTPTVLYDMTPAKDTCDLDDSMLYDNYVAETGGKTRIVHMAGGSRGYPYFELGTQELRFRWAACSNGGMPTAQFVELMLDEKHPIDLDGNGTLDVDALLHQVKFGGEPTLTVLISAR